MSDEKATLELPVAFGICIGLRQGHQFIQPVKCAAVASSSTIALSVRRDLFAYPNECSALVTLPLSNDERLVLCHATSKSEDALNVRWQICDCSAVPRCGSWRTDQPRLS